MALLYVTGVYVLWGFRSKKLTGFLCYASISVDCVEWQLGLLVEGLEKSKLMAKENKRQGQQV